MSHTVILFFAWGLVSALELHNILLVRNYSNISLCDMSSENSLNVMHSAIMCTNHLLNFKHSVKEVAFFFNCVFCVFHSQTNSKFKGLVGYQLCM